ncbi:MAG: formylglycine-generating enzyme family protein [Labilithrix sp.]|nr:formylglycine-generating enzyme family protein [Labilithrix sp.]
MPRRALVRGLIVGVAYAGLACSLLVDTDGLDGSGPSGPGPTSQEGGGEAAAPDGDVVGRDATSDAPRGAPPPSCAAPGLGRSDCGPSGAEDCCTSKRVEGGVYKRGHDGVILFDPTHPAQVSSFELDRFEVTVGRFRSFVDAVATAGWRPAAGSGKHGHLSAGRGLTRAPADPGQPFEAGWDPALSAALSGSLLEWGARLSCHPSYQTWSSSPNAKDTFPINCVSWVEAAAFCIWDGGFLPSEAELDYAGAGGDQQRVYPWSSPPTSTTVDCSHANLAACGAPPDSAPNAVGSRSPKGDGRWGHADLTGNVFEWAADIHIDPYVDPCVDCIGNADAGAHSAHGGGYFNPTSGAANGYRYKYELDARDIALGFRCARSP